jgi:hypothetical protein
MGSAAGDVSLLADGRFDRWAILECGDLSPLWVAVRSSITEWLRRALRQSGDKSPHSKMGIQNSRRDGTPWIYAAGLPAGMIRGLQSVCG